MRRPERVGEPTLIVPILELSGHSAGPSEPKLASLSRQALWPSAASGLIVSPGGSVTIADLICEGEAANPSNCLALRLMSSPEAESVSLVVGRPSSSGLKVSFSQPVDRRVAALGLEKLPGSW